MPVVQPSGMPTLRAQPVRPIGQFKAIDVVDHAKDSRHKTLVVFNKNDYERCSHSRSGSRYGYPKVRIRSRRNNQNGDQ